MRDLTHDVYPFYEPGGFPTCLCTTAVTGKRLVTISGNRTSGPGLSDTAEGGVYRVKQSDAIGQVTLGVAKTDAESGKLVGVIASPGIVLPVTAGAAIVAGQEVMVDATGRVIPWVPPNLSGNAEALPAIPHKVGLCLTAASAAGADAEIKLY